MAKAPSARVSKSSGQGTSRLSYQKGRQLGNKGMGETPMVKGEGTTAMKGARGGGKAKAGDAGDMNISYGDTLPISDLQTVADFGKGAKGGSALKPIPPTNYAKQKGDQGSGFNTGKRR